MTRAHVRRLFAMASAALLCSGSAFAQTVTQTNGPDIIVCSFPDVSNGATSTVNMSCGAEYVRALP